MEILNNKVFKILVFIAIILNNHNKYNKIKINKLHNKIIYKKVSNICLHNRKIRFMNSITIMCLKVKCKTNK